MAANRPLFFIPPVKSSQTIVLKIDNLLWRRFLQHSSHVRIYKAYDFPIDRDEGKERSSLVFERGGWFEDGEEGAMSQVRGTECPCGRNLQRLRKIIGTSALPRMRRTQFDKPEILWSVRQRIEFFVPAPRLTTTGNVSGRCVAGFVILRPTRSLPRKTSIVSRCHCEFPRGSTHRSLIAEFSLLEQDRCCFPASSRHFAGA